MTLGIVLKYWCTKDLMRLWRALENQAIVMPFSMYIFIMRGRDFAPWRCNFNAYNMTILDREPRMTMTFTQCILVLGLEVWSSTCA